jgi:hypothetical protein
VINFQKFQSEAYEGDTVIIGCEVIGDPKPDVIWLRDFLKVKLQFFFFPTFRNRKIIMFCIFRFNIFTNRNLT